LYAYISTKLVVWIFRIIVIKGRIIVIKARDYLLFA